MEDKIKDKAKMQEILMELSNLKKYANGLSDNTRGERLERYIEALSKNINLFDEKVEKTYEENFNVEE